MSKPSSPHLSHTLFEKDKPGISRREFGRRAALTAALCVSPGPALVGSSGSSPAASTPAQAKAAEQLTPVQTQEVAAKLANIIRKYGGRLTEAQREHLRRILTYNETMLASVRSFPLANGDPPSSVLRISFSEESRGTNSALSTPGDSSAPLPESQPETASHVA
jgi:hypothetical protein